MAVLIACSATLFGMTRADLIRSDTVWAVYAVIFASGIARSFLQPTRTALAAEVRGFF